MAEKYNNGGRSNSNSMNNEEGAYGPGDHQDGETGAKPTEKAGEYLRELQSEKIKLNNAEFPLTIKLIDEKVTEVQTTGRTPDKGSKYLDVYNEKTTKVTVKVLVPLKEHPTFNFVGNLLGHMGRNFKHLQEETMCRMAVRGRGSIKDRQMEDELRNSLDPKYAHLSDELHVEITALAPPAEAHARIAHALALVRKYLIPGPPPRNWTKVYSILDRVRTTRDTSYGDEHYFFSFFFYSR